MTTKQSIPGIDYCSSGAYSSPEGFNKGFTHGFLTTFANPEARDRYLPHPDHEKVKNALFAIIEDAVAFDFIADWNWAYAILGWPLDADIRHVALEDNGFVLF